MIKDVTRHYPGLQLHEDPTLHDRATAWQRAGWLALLALVVAGLLGVFGSGPVSSATAHTQAGLTVHYARFGRTQTPQTLHVRLPRADDTLWFANTLADSFTIDSIFPAPGTTLALADGISCRFSSHASADTPLDVQINLVPGAPGIVSLRIGSSPNDAVELELVVYP